MDKILRQAAIFALCGGVAIFTGCSGGGSDDPETGSNNNNPPPQQQPTTDLAPASIGNKTINGHIGGTSTTWQIVTSGTTSGTTPTLKTAST